MRTRIKEDGEGISENAEKILKKVYEDTLETAKTVSDQLATAAKKDWFIGGGEMNVHECSAEIVK